MAKAGQAPLGYGIHCIQAGYVQAIHSPPFPWAKAGWAMAKAGQAPLGYGFHCIHAGYVQALHSPHAFHWAKAGWAMAKAGGQAPWAMAFSAFMLMHFIGQRLAGQWPRQARHH